MRSGLLPSILLHLTVFLVCYIGLPKFKKELHQDYAIVAEVIDVSEITNVKVKRSLKEKAQKDAEKKAESKPTSQEANDKTKPEEIKVEKLKEEQAEKIPDKKVKEKQKDENKKPKETKDEAKQKKKTDDFAKSILKSLEGVSKKEKVDKEFSDLEKAIIGETNKEYNPNIPMSQSEKDAISSQISKNWNLSSFSGAAEAREMKVEVRIELDMEGNVTSVRPNPTVNSSKYYQAFVDSAVRAVKITGTIKNLNKDKYHTWKEIDLNFDASGRIY